MTYSTDIALSRTAAGLSRGKTYCLVSRNGHSHSVKAEDGAYVVRYACYSESYPTAPAAALAFLQNVGELDASVADGKGGYRKVRTLGGRRFYGEVRS